MKTGVGLSGLAPAFSESNTMPTKTKKPEPKPEPTEARIVCTCDRLPLETGEVLVRDMTATVPVAHAVAYEAQGRAKRG